MFEPGSKIAIAMEAFKCLTSNGSELNRVHGFLRVLYQISPTPELFLRRLGYVTRVISEFPEARPIMPMLMNAGSAVEQYIDNGTLTQETWGKYYTGLVGFLNAVMADDAELMSLDSAKALFRTPLAA